MSRILEAKAAEHIRKLPSKWMVRTIGFLGICLALVSCTQPPKSEATKVPPTYSLDVPKLDSTAAQTYIGGIVNEDILVVPGSGLEDLVCRGANIGNKEVLTVAHCVRTMRSADGKTHPPVDTRGQSVIRGVAITAASGKTAVSYNFDYINDYPNDQNHDVAVLTLDKELSAVPTLALSSEGMSPVGQTVYLASADPDQKVTSLNIYGGVVVRSDPGPTTGGSFDVMFLTPGAAGSKSVCREGASGTPLVTSNGSTVAIVGVTSESIVPGGENYTSFVLSAQQAAAYSVKAADIGRNVSICREIPVSTAQQYLLNK